MKRLQQFLIAALFLLCSSVFAQDKMGQEKASTMNVDFSGDQVIVTYDINLDKIPEQGISFSLSIPGQNGEAFRLMDRTFTAAELSNKQIGDSGRVVMRQVETLKRSDLQALAQDLADSGLVAFEVNKQPVQETQELIGCTSNGWAKITGTVNLKQTLFSVKASAGFDARTGCNNSLGSGSYAMADVEGSVYTDYSYGDDYLSAVKSKTCGSDPDYCTDQGAVVAKFSVLLVPENIPLTAQQVWPQL